MSFWTTSDYPMISLVGINEAELHILINRLTREDMIEWLMWNDPNGIYDDELSMKELGNIMSREEGIEIMLRQTEENRVIK